MDDLGCFHPHFWFNTHLLLPKNSKKTDSQTPTLWAEKRNRETFGEIPSNRWKGRDFQLG